MKLAYFLKHFSHQLIALASFCLLSHWISLPGWQPIALAVLVVWIKPVFRKQILLIASVAYAFFLFDFQIWSIGSKLNTSEFLESYFFWVKGLVLLATYTFSYYLITKRSWGVAGRQSHFVVFVVYNVFVILAAYLEVPIYLKYFLLVFGHYILFVGLVIQEQNSTSYNFKFLDFAFFRPMWTSSRAFPRISSFAALADSDVIKLSDFKKYSLSAFRLLLQSLLLLLICDFLYFFKFGKFEYLWFLDLNLPSLDINRQLLSLKQINSMGHSVLETWIVMVLTYSIYLLKVTYWGNIYISTARMMGFPLFRMAYRPWEARSLNDFFRRVHFYYYEIIRLLFFYPFLKLIKFRNPELRLFWVTFCAIFFGGGIQFHLFGFPEVAFRQEVDKIFWTWLPAGIYHLVFAIMLGISVLNEVKARRSGRKQEYLFFSPKGLLVSIFYLWTLSWIIAWGPEWPKPEIIDQLKFSFRMLGIHI